MTEDELHALICAWDDEEPGAEQVLYDAMEELGWPWIWKEYNPEYDALELPGFPVPKHITTINKMIGGFIAYRPDREQERNDNGVLFDGGWRRFKPGLDRRKQVEAFFKQYWSTGKVPNDDNG